MNSLAVILGSAFSDWPDADLAARHLPDTPWGRPSASIAELKCANSRVLLLQRHGEGKRILPHAINYRANIAALKSLGAKRVVALNVVGGICANMPPGALVLPNQIIDYSWGRAQSFENTDTGMRGHIDFTEPYSLGLRERLLHAAMGENIDCIDGGVYGVTQGPRLETAAEIQRLKRDGVDMVGMTGMPEAALAREAGMDYAAICMVVNWAAGIGDEAISLVAIERTMQEQASRVRQWLGSLLMLAK